MILASHMKEMNFAHDCVDVQFAYDINKVKNKLDAKLKNIFSSGGLKLDFRTGAEPTQSSLASIDSFTT